jgi:hypothetical protein
MEFGYLQLILAFSGDNLRPVQKLGKLYRTDTYSDVLTWERSRIFLLHSRQRVQPVKLRGRGAAAIGKQKGYKQ